MIRIASLLLLASTLSACAMPKSVTIDDAFKPYLETIQLEANKRGSFEGFTSITTIQFIDSFGEQNWDAYCSWKSLSGGTERTILVNAQRWQYLTDAERLALLIHELGHCVFKLEHNDTVFSFEYKDGTSAIIPVSLMYSNAVKVGDLIERKNELEKYYLDLFFKNK